MPNASLDGARPATPMEIAEWERFKRYYQTVLSKSVIHSKVTAEIANQAQLVVDQAGFPGFIFDAKSLADTQNLLTRYNMIGRYIAGVESGKYGINLKDGDIQIIAPASMPQSELETDLYPSEGFGVAPIIWALAIGVTLIAGIWGASDVIDSVAKRQAEIHKDRLMQADREMAKQPADVRQAWQEMKKSSAPAAREVGILEKFFGTEAAGKIGGGIGLGLLVVMAMYAFGQRKK